MFGRLLASLRQDTSYAIRTLRANPSFTVIAALSVALGIAANSTIFSMANAAMFGDMPVREPQALLTPTMSGRGNTFSYPNFQDYADSTRNVFEGVAAHFPVAPANLGVGDGESERIWGQMVTANYFNVVGAAPALGRGFAPDEDKTPGGNAVVVLSHGLWHRRFGGNPQMIGKNVLLSGRSYTVVGVAPKGFRGTERGLLPEFYVPLSMTSVIMPSMNYTEMAKNRDGQWLVIDMRLKPGVTKEQATVALNTVHRRLWEQYRKNEPLRPLELDRSGGLVGGGGRFAGRLFGGLMAVVGLVLLIACANVANLLLARASSRQKEIAVRLAVGAGRGRIVRQLLTESVLLAALGAVIGMGLTLLATQALGKLELPIPIPLALDFAPDWRVFTFTVGLAMLAGILFGLAPALRATRPDLMKVMKDEVTPLGSLRRLSLRNALVVVQVSLSLVLLVAAGLFLRSLQSASSVDLGVKADGVLILAVDPTQHGYDSEARRTFLGRLQQRVNSIAGVSSMAYADNVPLSIGGMTTVVATKPKRERGEDVQTDMFSVSPQYFATMGMPILQGRDFGAETAKGKKVALINRSLADKLFGKESPLGRNFYDFDGTAYEVIGVAGDSKSRTFADQSPAIAFRSQLQNEGPGDNFFGTALLVKTNGDPASYTQAIRQAVRELDPKMGVFRVETMQAHVDKALMLPRLAAALFGSFGLAGLLLATIGLYGVVSYGVRQRTREIGIRMALGAERGSVMRMVAGQGITLVAISLIIGLGLALAASQVAASLLFGISATDVVTFVGVPLVLLAVGLVAVLIPARRAVRVDPLRALRYE